MPNHLGIGAPFVRQCRLPVADTPRPAGSPVRVQSAALTLSRWYSPGPHTRPRAACQYAGGAAPAAPPKTSAIEHLAVRGHARSDTAPPPSRLASLCSPLARRNCPRRARAAQQSSTWSISCARPAATTAAENSTPATLPASSTRCSAALSRSSCRRSSAAGCQAPVLQRLDRGGQGPRTVLLLGVAPGSARSPPAVTIKSGLPSVRWCTRRASLSTPRQAREAAGEVGGNGRLGQQCQRQFHAVPVWLQFLLDGLQGMAADAAPRVADTCRAQEQARRFPPARQHAEQIEGGGITPVQVFEHQHQRLPGRRAGRGPQPAPAACAPACPRPGDA